MRNSVLPLAVLLAASTVAAQGEALYYKFNEGAGTTAINYGAAGTAPATGTITSTVPANYAPGFSSTALAGSTSTSNNTYVDTGYTGGVTGDFTVAWFMRQTGTPGTALSYQFSNWGSFRCFTNGVAGTGLWVRAWGGTPADLRLTADVQSLAASAWLHVALVVDATAATATFYLDGVAQTPIAIVGGANVVSANAFRIGAHTSSINFYDMDEFRFLTRAATPVEIRTWSQSTSGADSAFGAGCNGTMTGSGGEPVVGNATYGHSGTGPASSAGSLTIGFSSTQLGAIPLPINLGLLFPSLPGCLLYGSADLSVAVATDAAGNFAVPFPIPNNAALVSATLYNQALLLGGPGGISTTNAVALSVGL